MNEGNLDYQFTILENAIDPAVAVSMVVFVFKNGGVSAVERNRVANWLMAVGNFTADQIRQIIFDSSNVTIDQINQGADNS